MKPPPHLKVSRSLKSDHSGIEIVKAEYNDTDILKLKSDHGGVPNQRFADSV